MSVLDDVCAALRGELENGSIDLRAAATRPALERLGPVLDLFRLPPSFPVSGALLTCLLSRVTISGGSARFGLPDAGPENVVPVSVLLVCELDQAGAAAFEFVLSPTDPWTFDHSFPVLPPYEGYLTPDDPQLSWMPSFFKGLRLASPAFRGISGSDALELTGLLPPSGLLASYAELVSQWPLKLGGRMVLPEHADKAPELDLLAVVPDGDLDLGPVHLYAPGFRLRSVTGVTSTVYGVDAFSELDAAGTIIIGDRAPIRAQVSGPLTVAGSVWPLSVGFPKGEGSPTGLIAAIAELFGIDAENLAPPPGLGDFTGFQFTGVELWVELTNGRPAGVQAIAVSIGQTDPKAMWRPPVPFIAVGGLGTTWMMTWVPVGGSKTEAAIAGSIYGTLALGSALDPPLIDIVASVPQFTISGELRSTTPIRIGYAFKSFFGADGPPTTGDGLKITGLKILADLDEQSFAAQAQVTTDWPLPFFTSVSLVGLRFEIEATQSTVGGAIAGRLRLGSGVDSPSLAMRAEYPGGEASGWTFSGGLERGSSLDLAMLVQRLMKAEGDPALSLKIDKLEGSLTIGGASDGAWSFAGAVSTAFHVSLLGTGFDLKAGVAVALAKTPSATQAQGTLAAYLTINRLDVQISRDIGKPDPAYAIRIQFARLWLQAQVAGPADARVLTIQLGGMTLGEILEELVNLAAPTLGFKLDPPWDVLNRIDLSRFTLQVALKDPKVISLRYSVNADLIVMHLDELTVSYTMGGESSVKIGLTGTFLGLPLAQPLAWDVVKDPPPAIPGKGAKLFELRYLGFGQHVSLSANPETVRETVDLLAKEMKPKDGNANPLAGSLIRFDAGSQWLIGFDISIMETVDLAVIFNDPVLYGLSIGLRGKRAGALAGLRFEILYKKISDDVGMFRVELQVPEAFRRIELGAVSLTLGIVVVEIYTNGNFLIDLGFPHNRDYGRAFTVQMTPFIGRGGIYFGILDGATSRRVPKIVGGTFSPVIELGVGLAIGVGKEVSFGPMSGGAYLEVEVIFQGVLGWYHPASGGDTALYYRVQGIAAIHGKIYGEVDFKVVKASATIEAYAEVSVTFEAYRATLFELKASVDVEAEVEILWVSVSFSFSAEVSIDITVGSDSPPPWTLAPASGGPALAGPLHRPARLAALQAAQRDISFVWNENLVVLAHHPVTVPLSIVPAFTIADPPLAWSGTAPVNPHPEHRVAILLFADNGVGPGVRTAAHAAVRAADDTPSAAVLVEALLRWAFAAVNGGSPPVMLTAGEIDALAAELARPATETQKSVADTAFALDRLTTFLGLNVTLAVGAGTSTPRGAMVVAMPPYLTLSAAFGATEESRDLSAFNKVGTDYEAGAAAYMRQFSPTPGAAGYWPPDDPAKYESIASLMFRDWCLMITRAAVREAKRGLEDVTVTAGTSTLDDVAAHSLPRDVVNYVVRLGDTPAGVAEYVGAGLAEIEALNPTLASDLETMTPGVSIPVTVGVTGASLVLANPEAPLLKDASFQLTGVETQIRAADTSLDKLAGRLLGPHGTAASLVAAAALEADPRLLRSGAVFIVPVPDNPVAGADALTTAAILYVRLFADTQAPDADWYAQAIAHYNPDAPVGGPLPTELQVPTQPHSDGATVPYTTLPGDTLLRIGSALSLARNPDGYAVEAWQSFRTSVRTVSNAVKVPPTPTSVQPGETLALLAERLIAGSGDVAALLPWIQDKPLLRPLARVVVGTLDASAAEGATLRSIAEDHGMTMTQLAGQAGITGNAALFAASTSFNAPRLPAQTTEALVAAALDSVGLSAISAEASRQMLGGLRLPEPVDAAGHAEPTGPPTAVAELAGQQLPSPSIASGLALTVTAARIAGAPDWVTMQIAPVVRSWTSADLADLYPAVALAVAPESPTPRALPLAGQSPRTYGLDHRIELQSAIDLGMAAAIGPARLGNASLWPFPATLLARARAAGMTKFELVRAASGTAAAAHDPLLNTTFATLVAVTIRAVPGYPHVYQLLGPQDSDRDLLLELATAIRLENPAAPTRMFIAIAPTPGSGNPSGLAILDADAKRTFVIRANLASDVPSTTAPTRLHASLDHLVDFLRLAWEASAAGEGFHFYFAGSDGEDLPAGAFDEQGTARLHFLAVDGAQQAAPDKGRALLRYNNCALVGPGFDASTHALYAEAYWDATNPVVDPAELVPHALVPAGSAGIQLRIPRIFPLPSTDPNAAAARLGGLYSLLRFAIGAPYATSEAPPVAPHADDGLGHDAWQRARMLRHARQLGLATRRGGPVPTWRYEQVVNVAKFGPASLAPAAAGLPSPEDDPYRGYGAAEVQWPPFKLAFGDLLGNRTIDLGRAKEVPVELGYTDPLVGISAWPGATMAYLPSATAGEVTLSVTLAAQPGTAVPGASDLPEAARRAASEQAARYSEIWFQIVQPTMSAYLLTTLATTDGAPRRLALTEGTAPLQRFVASCCLYTGAAATLVPAPVAPGSTLAAILASHGLGVAAIAQANAETAFSALFTPGQALAADAYATVLENQSAKDIVTAAPEGPKPANGKALLLIDANAALPLRPGTVLALQDAKDLPLGPTVPTKPLAALAGENGTTAAQLAIDNRTNEVLQPGFEFHHGGLIVTVGGPMDGIRSLDQVQLAFAAHGVDVPIAELAALASERPGLFEPDATLTLKSLVVPPPIAPWPAPPPSLASMAVGITLDSLATANEGTANLFAAGTQVSLGPWPPALQVPSSDETLGAFAARYRLGPAELLAANTGLTLAARSSLVLPGAVTLPADVDSVHLPYAVMADDSLATLAPCFATSAASLVAAVEKMPGTLLAGQSVTVAVGGVEVSDRTQAADSFHALLLRLQAKNGAVTMAGLVSAVAGQKLLAPGALMVVPPPALRPKTGAVPAAMTAEQVALAYGADRVAFAAANAATAGLLAPSVAIKLARPDGSEASVTTAEKDTLNAVLSRLAHERAAGSIEDLLDANRDVPLYQSGARAMLPPLPASVSAAIGDGKGPFSAAALPLTVTLRLQRSWQAVHSEFHVGAAGTDGGGTAERSDSMVPAPRSSTGAGASRTSDAFAQACLLALPDLRLATGRVDGIEADLWAVDFGDHGIKMVSVAPGVSYGPSLVKDARFFALRPLYKDLVGPTAQVRPVGDDGTLGPAAPRTFSGIDAEQWARRLLADLDLYLSAPYAAQILLTSGAGALDRLLQAKWTLANAIAAGLAPVLDVAGQDMSTGWAAAQAMVQAQSAVSLSRAYVIAVIAQYDTAAESAYVPAPPAPAPLPARLTGVAQAKGEASKTAHFSLSTGRTSLAASPAFTSFAVTVPDPANHAHIDTALDFDFDTMEFDIDATKGIDGYEDLDRLTFVPRLAGSYRPTHVTTDLGEKTCFPIPLRTHPAVPVLVAQTAAATHPGANDLAQVAQWTFSLTYAHEHAEQDEVQVDAAFNIPALVAADSVGDTGLAPVLAAYAAIAEDLGGLMSWYVNPPDGVSQEQLALVRSNVAASVADLVEPVASAWAAHWSPSALAAREMVVPAGTRFGYRLTVERSEDDDKIYLTGLSVSLAQDSPGPGEQWPQVVLVMADGSEVAFLPETPGSGTYRPNLAPGERLQAPDQPSFRLFWPGLNIAAWQNARSSILVRRNPNLREGTPTSDAFILTTARISAPDLVTPLLIANQDIVLPAALPAAALQSAFTQLFGSATGMPLTIAISYGYWIVPPVPPDGGLSAFLPVALYPGHELSTGDAGTAEKIATAIAAWQAAHRPAVDGARWSFSLTLHSQLEVGGEARPLLRIERLALPIAA